MLRKTQRRAWKALSRVRRSRRPLRRPHSARRGPRERPVAARESRVCVRSGLRAALAVIALSPPGLRPRARLGGEARRESGERATEER